MDDSGDSAARAALERVLGADVARRATLHALEGGLKRRSFLVSADDRPWVLRLPAPGAQALLDLATEAEVMAAAARAGLAPNVVAADVEAGILLADHRANARAWTAADAREPRNVERAAALLRALHGLDVRAPAFAAERIARGYLDSLALGVGTRFDLRDRAWADELLERARRYDATQRASALCHNDLVAANVLDDGRLVLVDFEYAVRAAPVLDLAGLVGMNDFAARERRALLEAYAGEDARPIAEPELEATVRLVRLIAYFWSRLGEASGEDPAAYRELAAEVGARLR